MRLYQAIGNPTWQASVLNSMGWYAALLGRFTQAHEHREDALKLHRQDGYRQGEAGVLDSLGYIAHQSGDLHLALDYFTHALSLFRDLGNEYDEADTLNRVGHTFVDLNRFNEARAHGSRPSTSIDASAGTLRSATWNNNSPSSSADGMSVVSIRRQAAILGCTCG